MFGVDGKTFDFVVDFWFVECEDAGAPSASSGFDSAVAVLFDVVLISILFDSAFDAAKAQLFRSSFVG